MKLLVPGAADGLVGRGINPNKKAEVGLRRLAGITFPANAVRGQVEAAGQVNLPYSRLDEHFTIWLCRGLSFDMRDAWIRLKNWS